MPTIDGALFDLKNLDQLALGSTAIHRLDPRAKVLVTLFFIVTVVSFGKYELAALFPFFIFPVFMMTSGNLPVKYIVRKVLVVIPFALIIGLFNPVFDRAVLIHAGSLGIAGGWISWASIVCRAVLALSSAIILVGVTGFPAICSALERLGVPQAFALQLHFLYRYIFVLTEEGSRMARARELRAFGSNGKDMKTFGAIIGSLLLRTWQRAERIHMAMLARGFNGDFHTRQLFRFGKKEVSFLFIWTLVFILMRLQNIPQLLGQLVVGFAQ